MENITLKCIHKIFDGRVLFDDLSLVLRSGRITCITGPSGCGKTTLMRMLMGLESPDSGSIEGLEGLRISAVFQEDRLCGMLSASANAAIALKKGMHRSHSDDILRSLGLGNDLLKPVSALSGGMRRRVAIARALAADYDILILDEPFTGLDIAMRNCAIERIKHLCKGKTVFLVTHDPEVPGLISGDILDFEALLRPQM